jgi:hypothetical protein
MKTLVERPGFSSRFLVVDGRFKPGKMHGGCGEKPRKLTTVFN